RFSSPPAWRSARCRSCSDIATSRRRRSTTSDGARRRRAPRTICRSEHVSGMPYYCVTCRDSTLSNQGQSGFIWAVFFHVYLRPELLFSPPHFLGSFFAIGRHNPTTKLPVLDHVG